MERSFGLFLKDLQKLQKAEEGATKFLISRFIVNLKRDWKTACWKKKTHWRRFLTKKLKLSAGNTAKIRMLWSWRFVLLRNKTQGAEFMMLGREMLVMHEMQLLDSRKKWKYTPIRGRTLRHYTSTSGCSNLSADDVLRLVQIILTVLSSSWRFSMLLSRKWRFLDHRHQICAALMRVTGAGKFVDIDGSLSKSCSLRLFAIAVHRVQI